MSNNQPSGQTARLLRMERHPQWPNHAIVTAAAETFCQASETGFSDRHELILVPDQQVTFTVARDVFARKKVGEVVDGAFLAYYAMRGEPVLVAA